jgi:hypothetical protein
MTLINTTLGLGRPPRAPRHKLDSVRPLAPARKGHTAFLSYAGMLLGIRVYSKACRITMKLALSLALDYHIIAVHDSMKAEGSNGSHLPSYQDWEERGNTPFQTTTLGRSLK